MTEKIALVVAGLLLLVLAGTKYSEYLESKLEKQVLATHAEARAEIEARDRELDARLRELEARLSGGAVDPLAKDREVLALRKELAAVSEERQVMDGKLDEINRQQRIDQLGGTPTPDLEAGLSKAERSIRRATPIASVTDFNKEWGFVMLDAGKRKGLTVGTRLALRRGSDIVALVDVSTVEDDTSVGSLVRGGPGGAGNALPIAGDVAISWPPL